VTLSETPLGFRHGPKTVVNGKTLVVMFLCNDPYTRGYELDVLDELRADGVAAQVVVLGAEGAEGAERARGADGGIEVPGAKSLSSLGLCFPYAVFAQSLALLQSLALGLTPDVPNAKGVVNRVVPGFTIHAWNAPR
jgi:tagatose-6-phosphate ketose/aldose isomerase